MDSFELYPRGRLNAAVARVFTKYRTKSGSLEGISGTGTIIYNCSGTVLILTCGHIVSVHPDKVARYAQVTYSVSFPDNEGKFSDDISFSATLLTDPQTHLQEIAVLKLEKVPASIGNKVAVHFRTKPLIKGMPLFTCSNMSLTNHFSHLSGRLGSRSSLGMVANFDESYLLTVVEFTLDAGGSGASGSAVFDLDGNMFAILVSRSILICPPGRPRSRMNEHEHVLADYKFEYGTHIVSAIPIAPVLDVLRRLIPHLGITLVSATTTFLTSIKSHLLLPSSSSSCSIPSVSYPLDPLEGFPWADHCKKAVKITAQTSFYSGRLTITFGSGTIVAKNQGFTLVLTSGRIVHDFFNHEVERVDFFVQFCDNEPNRMGEGVSIERLVAHLVTDDNMMLGEHMALLYVKDPLGRGEIARFRERDLVNGMQVVMCANNFYNRYSFVTGRVTSRDVKDDEFEFDTPVLTYVEYAIATDLYARGAGLFDLEGNLVAVHVAPCNRICKVSPPSSDVNLLADHKIYHAGPLAKGIPIKWISRVLSTLCKRFQLNIDEGPDSANLLNLCNSITKAKKPLPAEPSTQITSPLPKDPLQTFNWVDLCKVTVRVKIRRLPRDAPDDKATLTGTIIFVHAGITLILTCGLHVMTCIYPDEQMCTFSIEFPREDGEELCPTLYKATLLSNEEALKEGIAIFSVKDSGKRKVAQFRKDVPLDDGMQLLMCAVHSDYKFLLSEGRVSSRHVHDSGFVEYPIMTRDLYPLGAGLFDIHGNLAAVHVEEVWTPCRIDPPILDTSDLDIYWFWIPGRFCRGIPIDLVIVALRYLCRSLGLKIDMTEATVDMMLRGICEYAQAMPTSGGNSSFPSSQRSTEASSSGKENLCSYGFPSERWEFPPELPGPALGINFARDRMQGKDWLALVAVRSDARLLSVAFYSGARRRLVNMINDFPAIFEALTGNAKKQVKERATVSNRSWAKSKSSTKKQHPGMKVKHAKKEEGGLEEEASDTSCGDFGETYASDEFWICCDTCKTWFRGKCVKMKPSCSSLGNQAVQMSCLACKNKRSPDFLDVSRPDFTSLVLC